MSYPRTYYDILIWNGDPTTEPDYTPDEAEDMIEKEQEYDPSEKN